MCFIVLRRKSCVHTYVHSRQWQVNISSVSFLYYLINLIVQTTTKHRRMAIYAFPANKNYVAKIMNNFAKSAKKKESIFLPLFLLLRRKRACATTF